MLLNVTENQALFPWPHDDHSLGVALTLIGLFLSMVFLGKTVKFIAHHGDHIYLFLFKKCLASNCTLPRVRGTFIKSPSWEVNNSAPVTTGPGAQEVITCT